MKRFKRKSMKFIAILLTLAVMFGMRNPVFAIPEDVNTTEGQTVDIEDNIETNETEESDEAKDPDASEESDETDRNTDDDASNPITIPETETSEETDESKEEVIYDWQPTTLEEVQATIDAYEVEYQIVLAAEGLLEALKVQKPHWKYEVAADLIPENYNCQLVDWDEDFGADYYTFFPNPMAMAFGTGQFVIEPKRGDDIRPFFPSFVGNTKVDVDYTNVAIATSDAKNQFGAMWANEKLDLSLPFSTSMELHLGHSASPADSGAVADGMTFTMHNYKDALTKMIGGRGEGLGVWTGRNNSDVLDGSYLPYSLVIEFDTYINQGSSSTVSDPVSGDPDKYAHCALIYPRANSRTNPILSTDHKNTYYFAPTQKWVVFTVNWEPKYNDDNDLGGILTYTFDGVEQKEVIDDVTSVFGGTSVWWGFTGATGAQTAVQAAAIIKLPSPQYNLNVVKSVKNEAKEDINGKYAYAGDMLTYTIRVTGTMTTGGSSIGPISIEDKLSAYADDIIGDVTVTMNDGSQLSNVISNVVGGTLTVDTGCYLATSGDWLELTFKVKAKADAGMGTIVDNTVSAEANNLEGSFNSNTTRVTIMEDASKSVAAGSPGYNGAEVTIGDKITYKISYFNSTDQNTTLIITDSLPEGVTYVEASATDNGIYDSINHRVTWNFSNIEAGKGGIVSFTVEVTKDVDRDEELVNTALLDWGIGNDENPSTSNPVTGYKVTYVGNGGATDLSKTTYVDEGLFPIGADYTVLGNNVTGFVRSGYIFLGWNTASDGSGDAYNPTDTFEDVESDITLYARWSGDLVFRKIDAESVSNASITALTGARFELYECSHVHDAACGGQNDPSACSHDHTPLIETGTCWNLSAYTAAYADSIVTFTGLMDGNYLLMETTAPDGYRLPKGQWIIGIESGEITFTGISGDSDIPAVIAKANFEGKEVNTNVEFWIGNIMKYELPAAGFGGTFWYTALGGLLLTAGLLMGIWYHRHRRGNRYI